MIADLDNPPFAPPPACPSCNTPWKDHDPLTVLCFKHQEQCKVFRSLAEQHLELLDAFRIYKENHPETPIPTEPHIIPLPEPPES